jgi:1,2-dihydroxy-3-keto-5-methylthiopentene dioxygenase
LNRLLKKTGIFYCKVEIVNLADYRKRIDLIRADRKYTYVDDCTYQAGVTKDYEEKLPKWFESHIHDDDEARLVMEGSGFYDVQEAKTSKWIRICMEAGDMLIIPAGCIHRFTPDMKNLVKFRRFFHQQETNTPTFTGDEIDAHPARIEYLKRLKGEENGTEGACANECSSLTNAATVDNEIKARA